MVIPDPEIIDRHLDGVASSLAEVREHHRKMIQWYFGMARAFEQSIAIITECDTNDSGVTGEKKES